MNLVLDVATPPLPQQTFDPQGWTSRLATHGFVDFGHVHRPEKRGVGVFDVGAASARCILHASKDFTARFQLACDDRLILRVNEHDPIDLGLHDNFGNREP